MEAIRAKLELIHGEKDAQIIQYDLTESQQLMPEMRTLSFCLNKSLEHGYKENFKATAFGLKSMESGNYYSSSETKIVNFYHFEGSVNPTDMAVLYLIEMNDGAKGTLVDIYGTYSDALVAKWVGEMLTAEKH